MPGLGASPRPALLDRYHSAAEAGVLRSQGLAGEGAPAQLLSLTTLRRTCPVCEGELATARHVRGRSSVGVRAIIVAEPEAYAVSHYAKVCARCSAEPGPRTKYWCGYYETLRGKADACQKGKWVKHIDGDFA